MTGYAAIIGIGSAEVGRADLEPALPALRQRGPHGTTVTLRDRFAVATAILDVGDARLLAAHASDGPLIVAGQVRLDGREALVEALRPTAEGVTPDDPDMRLLALAWRAWASEAPVQLLGDFSAVLHDGEARTTTLLRDIYGVRPLYYHVSTDRVAVSNTIDAILVLPGVSRTLDEDAMTDFLVAGFIEDEEATAYREIRCVPSAHTLTIEPDGRRVLRRYWDVPTHPPDRSRSSREIVAGMRAVLSESVRDRVRTSRLTVFMSGGLDSTTLAAIAARSLEHPVSLVARTVDVPSLVPSKEADGARAVASLLGCTHVISDTSHLPFTVGVGDDVATLSTPEPLDEPGLGALHADLRAASHHSPVAFWGEGADALMMPPHVGDLLRGASLLDACADVVGYLWRFRRRPFLDVRGLVRGMTGRTPTPSHERAGPDWIRPDLVARREARLRLRRETRHPTRSMAAGELAPWHWRPLFELFDAGVHALPIDVRFPYLDRRLIEYVLSVPPIPWMQRKHLLREAAHGLLPEAVCLAPKQGMSGLYEARVAQWWVTSPAPFNPSSTLASLVDVGRLPAVHPGSDVPEMVVHFRLRLLDEWLRTREQAGGEDPYSLSVP